MQWTIVTSITYGVSCVEVLNFVFPNTQKGKGHWTANYIDPES